MVPLTVSLAELSIPSALKLMTPMSATVTRVSVRVCFFPCVAIRHTGLDLNRTPSLVHSPLTYAWLRTTSNVQASFSHSVTSSSPFTNWILFTLEKNRGIVSVSLVRYHGAPKVTFAGEDYKLAREHDKLSQSPVFWLSCVVLAPKHKLSCAHVNVSASHECHFRDLVPC